MKRELKLRDFLYLDFDKAASIWSQLDEGLLERVSVTEDSGKDRTAGTKFGIPKVAEANLGVEYAQKRSVLESRTLHHDILTRIEERLNDAELVADLTRSIDRSEISARVIRNAIGERPYLRADGQAVLEDYRRILAISEKFNDIVGLITRSAVEGMKKSEEHAELQRTVREVKEAIKRIPDRNHRAVRSAKLKEMEGRLEEMLRPKLDTVDQWLIDGMRTFINTFMPTRINFRIYPFPNCPSFQVLCNLKRECFVDADLEHLLYGYGNRPNVRLAVFGLITSIPEEIEQEFDPLKEFDADVPPSDRATFEKAFRGLFGGMEGLESLVRYSRYPNVTIHPIAVYRSFVG